MNIISLLEPNEKHFFNCDPLTEANKFTILMLLVLHPNIDDHIDNFKLIISLYDKQYLNRKNSKELTALHMLCANSVDKNQEILKILIDAGADLNSKSIDGMTALMFAVKNSGKTSSENTVKMLIDAQADLNAKNKDGWTALMFAVKNNEKTSSKDTVKMLIDAGANLNAKTKNG